MKTLLLLSVIFFLSESVFPQKPMFSEPYSPRIANYKIDITLTPDDKQLKGSEILIWRNSSPDEIKDLQFHLYLNAFKNELSTFMKESRGSHRGTSKTYKRVCGGNSIEL